MNATKVKTYRRIIFWFGAASYFCGIWFVKDAATVIVLTALLFMILATEEVS